MLEEPLLNTDQQYLDLLKDIKHWLKTAQLKTAAAINRELLALYWEVGRRILKLQASSKWGDKVLNALEKDLRSSFPDIKGFSKTNLKYMRLFAQTYPDFQIGQTVSDQLTWSHHIALLQYTQSENERNWYTQQIIENGWSFRTLQDQLKADLFARQGQHANKTNNFHISLPMPQSRLALETLKDPYKLDFLTIGEDVYEREIEQGLVSHMTKFLLEMGQGFAFVGNQYRLKVGNAEYSIDLLFYHLKLRCYIICELKAGEFKAEHAGKLNFYLSAADDLLRTSQDNPSIGLILCEKKDKLVAEYALKDINKPIGISEYTLLRQLPEKLQPDLPTIEAIEAELNIKRSIQKNK